MCDAIHHLFLFLFGADRPVDRTALWTGVIAMTAVIGVIYAGRQLHNIRRTSQADFAKRFIDSFFTSETRALFTLLMNSALGFDVRIIKNGDEEDRLPYFPIKPEIVEQIKGLIEPTPADRTGYSGLEVDDLLLGQFESLAWYVKKGLIDYDTALENFRYYLVHVWENPAIQKYAADGDNEGMYENIRNLYARFKAS
jgi:hypothetical protein